MGLRHLKLQQLRHRSVFVFQFYHIAPDKGVSVLYFGVGHRTVRKKIWMSETSLALQERVFDHHFWRWQCVWRSQFSPSFFLCDVYKKSRQSVKRSLIGQIICACDNCQTGYQNFAGKKTEYLSLTVIPVLTFWLAGEISYWVASLRFYFLSPLLRVCDREEKNQSAATIHEK